MLVTLFDVTDSLITLDERVCESVRDVMLAVIITTGHKRFSFLRKPIYDMQIFFTNSYLRISNSYLRISNSYLRISKKYLHVINGLPYFLPRDARSASAVLLS